MRENRTSGSMSGERKRSDGHRAPCHRASPRLYSPNALTMFARSKTTESFVCAGTLKNSDAIDLLHAMYLPHSDLMTGR
jgi:hypothetical protein